MHPQASVLLINEHGKYNVRIAFTLYFSRILTLVLAASCIINLEPFGIFREHNIIWDHRLTV